MIWKNEEVNQFLASYKEDDKRRIESTATALKDRFKADFGFLPDSVDEYGHPAVFIGVVMLELKNGRWVANVPVSSVSSKGRWIIRWEKQHIDSEDDLAALLLAFEFVNKLG